MGKATKLGGMAAGVAAGNYIEDIPGVSDLDPAIVGGGKVLVGLIGPDLAGKKMPIVGDIGDGLMASGIDDLLGAFVPGYAEEKAVKAAVKADKGKGKGKVNGTNDYYLSGGAGMGELQDVAEGQQRKVTL